MSNHGEDINPTTTVHQHIISLPIIGEHLRATTTPRSVGL